MYWYVYFNLFQDLILRLWPWNQYLHLWSTTFNQFCPRLLSTMDCLWLDTCKQSSIALSQALSFFLYFFFFPPTGCLLCRCAVGGNWSLKSEIGCWSSSYSFNRLFALLPSFLGVLLRLSPPCSARDWQLYGSDSWQTKHVANGRTRQAHAEQMQMALGSVVSLFFSLSLCAALSVSPFLPHLPAGKCIISFLRNIAAAYVEIWCGIPLTALQNCVPTNITKSHREQSPGQTREI